MLQAVERIASRLGFLTPGQTTQLVTKSVEEAVGALVSQFETEFGHAPAVRDTTTVELHSRVVWIYAYVFAISTTIASVPLVLRKMSRGKDGRADFEDVPDHPASLRLDSPNLQGMSKFDLVEAIAAWLEITGNCYMQKTLTPTGWEELWPIPSHRVTVSPRKAEGGHGPLLAGRFDLRSADGEITRIPPEEIIHFRQFSTDPIVGMGSVAPAVKSATAWSALQDGNVAWLRNGARPDVVVSTGMPYDAKKQAAIKAAWRAAHQGVDKTGGVKILWQGATADVLSNIAKDMDFPALNGVLREEILGAGGVPPFKLGLLDHANYANSQEQRHEFLTGTVSPKLRKIESTLTRETRRDYGDDTLVWTFDTSEVEGFHEDRNELHERVRNDFKTGLLTRGEAREKIGEDLLGDDRDEELFRAPAQLFGSPAGIDQEGTGVNLSVGAAPPRRKFAEAERVALWKQFEKATDSGGEKIGVAFRRMIETQVEQALAGFDAAEWRPEAITQVLSFLTDKTQIAADAERFQAPMQGLVIDGVARASRQVDAMLRRNFADAFADEAALLDSEALGYASRHAAELVTNTNATTRGVIRNIVNDGLAAGESESQLALNIQERMLSDEFLSSRTLTIARTESAAAFNFGSFVSYGDNDGVAEKEWLSSRDEHVRDPITGASVSHRIDGQRKPVNSPFEIPTSKGIVLLQYPAEYGISASSTINCRCTMIPVVASGLVAA